MDKVNRKPMMPRLVLVFLIGGFLAVSCFDPPEIPVVPSISVKSFNFKRIPGNNIQDSMVVELNFEDGDGDLGLTTYDVDPPFHEYDFVLTNQGDFLKLGDPGTPPYSCRDYEEIEGEQYYVVRNDYHYNFHLDFYRKINGEFELYDFYAQDPCSPGFKSRFFHLNTRGDERPIKGVLRYGVTSAFRLLFRNDTLKFSVYIFDRNEKSGSAERDLNKSNIVESREFTLSEFLGEI